MSDFNEIDRLCQVVAELKVDLAEERGRTTKLEDTLRRTAGLLRARDKLIPKLGQQIKGLTATRDDFHEDFEMARVNGNKSRAEVERLRIIENAAQALIAKLEECAPHISSAFVMAYHVRGGTYTGPSYHDERVALAAALEATP